MMMSVSSGNTVDDVEIISLGEEFPVMKHSALTPTLNPTGGARGVDERRRNMADTSSLELAGALLQAHVVSDTISHRTKSSADPHPKKPSTGPEQSGTRRLDYSPPILSLVNPGPVQLSQ